MILMRKSAFILNLMGQETEQGMVDQIAVEHIGTTSRNKHCSAQTLINSRGRQCPIKWGVLKAPSPFE